MEKITIMSLKSNVKLRSRSKESGAEGAKRITRVRNEGPLQKQQQQNTHHKCMACIVYLFSF